MVPMVPIGRALAVAAALAGCSFEGGSGVREIDASTDASAIDGADIDGAVSRGERVSCAPLEVAQGATVVDTEASIVAAVANAAPGETIAIASGTYLMTTRLFIMQPGVTLRSVTGNPDDVVLIGDPAFFSVLAISVSNVTVAGLTFRTARRGIRIVPDSGVELLGTVITHTVIEDVTEVGIDVRENGGSSADGLVACSKISAEGVGACDNFLVGVEFEGDADRWRVSENTIGPACPRTDQLHVGLRFAGNNTEVVVDHNRFENWFNALQIGNSSPSGPMCDGPNGSGWEVYEGVVCANTVVNTLSMFEPASGITFLQACDSLAIFNTVASELGPSDAIRFSGAGSLVTYGNNAVTSDVNDNHQSPPPIAGPNEVELLTGEFVEFPTDLRLRVQEPTAIDFSANPLAERYCSWDLAGVERDPANPGYGAFAP